MNQLREQILQKTDNGRDVFTHYFGSQAGKKVFTNVYRNDVHPSCVLKLKNGRYILKDYGNTDWYGDCFTIVAMIEQLSVKYDFTKIMSIINTELSLGLDVSEQISSEYRIKDLPIGNTTSTSKIKSYRHKPMAFSSNDLSWWGRYGITLKVLNQYHVICLERCSFYREDNTSFALTYSEQYPLYAYLFLTRKEKQTLAGIKIYHPGAQLRFIQAGSLPKPYRFGYEQLPEQGDTLYIVGGEKDVMTMAAKGLAAVCYNSETALLPTADIKEYHNRFSRIVILYDMDDTGIKSSHKLVGQFRELLNDDSVFRGELPLSGAKFDKDVSDYFAKGKSVELFFNDITLTI